jgi:hypothetical protein
VERSARACRTKHTVMITKDDMAEAFVQLLARLCTTTPMRPIFRSKDTVFRTSTMRPCLTYLEAMSSMAVMQREQRTEKRRLSVLYGLSSPGIPHIPLAPAEARVQKHCICEFGRVGRRTRLAHLHYLACQRRQNVSREVDSHVSIWVEGIATMRRYQNMSREK